MIPLAAINLSGIANRATAPQSVENTSPSAKVLAQTERISDPALAEAARDFETIFVRQLLQNAKIAGSETERGYSGMIVDSMANAISSGGGLGLARHIEQTMMQLRRLDPEGS